MSDYFLKMFYVFRLLFLMLSLGSTLEFKNTTTTTTIERVESKCIETEKQALLEFKQSIVDYFNKLSTWEDKKKDGDCCKWRGIECNDETGHVKKLDLHGDYRQWLLSNAIDFTSLTSLENMEYLDLSNNYFTGSHISEHIGSLTKLRYLNLSNSKFDGRIPNQIGNLLELEYLDLSLNYLYGKIPSKLRNLSQLQYLDIEYNNLSGVVPFNVGDFPVLHTLRLDTPLDLTYNLIKWLSAVPLLTNLVLRRQSLLPFDYSLNHLLQTISRKIVQNLKELRLVGFGLMDNDVSTLFHSHSNFTTSLTILDFSNNMLTSSTFQFLSNLSHLNLHELHLSENNIVLSSHLYPNMPSLVILDLSHNNLTSSQFIGNFNFSSKLQELYLTNCNLTDESFLVSSSSTLKYSSSSSLLILDLSSNLLRSSSKVYFWIFNFTTNLHILDLHGNLLEGRMVDDGFWKVMKSLERIDLSHNHLQGEIPSFFGNICTLQSLQLSHNNFSGEVSNFIQTSSWCNKHILWRLDLSYNRITGVLPKSICMLTELEALNLAGNSLEGDIVESHLTNFSKLRFLLLSYNSLLSLTLPHSWIPPFQLISLILASCNLGSSFPSWLQNQRYIRFLDISDAGINDYVPEWIWNNSQNALLFMNMSHNNLIGTIPNFSFKFPQNRAIILNSNQFEGEVPSFLRQTTHLTLSENKFSHLFSFLCDKSPPSTLATLDLSNNQIKGQLPDCWNSVNTLLFLDLSNNKLSGKIPQSMRTLAELEALVLRNNSLNGELPSALKNCSNLLLLDVGENLLSGSIPSWIGENMQQLIILSMTGNQFFGNIPIHLCYLRQIQLLDLSRNNLSEGIPTCLDNFTALSEKSINTSETESQIYSSRANYYVSTGRNINGYVFNISVFWKGMERGFKRPETLLKSIDLSSNNLKGGIPKKIGYLVGLVSLNLSRNNLSGEIPYEIGNLVSLDVLDLSRNHFSGNIPTTLSQIDRLEVLDLSNNSLIGRIPTGRQLQTLDPSGFEGNLDLCGVPLEKTCPEDVTKIVKPNKGSNDNSVFHEGFYLSLGLGYFTGFWGLMGPILLWRPWRIVYLRFLNKLIDYIYVLVVVNVAKFRRWLKC